MGDELGFVIDILIFKRGLVTKIYYLQLLNNIPADIALMLLIEKSSASEDELQNNFNIYDTCKTKTGKTGSLERKKMYGSLPSSGPLRNGGASLQVWRRQFGVWNGKYDRDWQYRW
jgi:hypothetical protein